MDLREAAQQALDALEEHRTVRLHDGDYLGVCAWCGVDSCDPCDHRCLHSNALSALRAALADTQDWNEVEALRASLREHMAEIHRLNECLTWEQHRAEHVGTHGTGCAEWGPKHYECLLQEYEALKARIESTKMVEPVAYVTGYRDGFCVISPVEHVVFPTGMALYLSPPTSQESRQVEPVAYMSMCFSNGQTKPHSKTLFWPEQYTGRTEPVDAGAWGEERVVPLYTAPPKREPLTDAEIAIAAADIWGSMLIAPQSYRQFARAIERAHGIGGEE